MSARMKEVSLCVAALAALVSVQSAEGSLIGYWPMNIEPTGPAGTSGTLVGTVVSAADRNGDPNSAMSFASTGATSGSYANIPGGGGLNGATTASISLWVRWNGIQDNGVGNRHGAVLGRQKNGTFSDSLLCLYNTSNPNTSNINWETRLNAGMGSGVAAGDGVWRHVAVTISPAGETLYVDGAVKATRAAVGGFNNDASIPLTIGAWIGDGGSYSTSTIDDVAVFNHVLTPAEVTALASSPTGPLGAEIRPVGGRASSELTGGHNRRVGNLSDGLGRNTTSTNDWAGNTGGMWLSASGDKTGWVNFDLGGLHQVDWMSVHNYNEGGTFTNRGVQTADVRVSTDNVNWTSLGVQTFAKAPGNDTNPGQLFSLGGVQARYVQLGILSNYGDTSYAGLNEVDFYGRPVGPMPIQGVTAASSSLYGGGFDRRPLHTVDATGLYAGTHYNNPDGTMWLSAGLNFTGAPGDDANPEIVFDLQQRYERLEGMRVWNYNEANFLYRGVKDMEILVSDDGTLYRSLGIRTLAQAPGDSITVFGQDIYLGASGVRYVKFDILSNWRGVTFPASEGNSANDFAFVGLSEVRFNGETVPEPATLALLGLAGTGLGGYLRRRRSR